VSPGRVETLGEHGVTDALKALDLRIARNQVVERRLDQGERAHVRRPLSRCNEGPEDAVRVSDDVRTRAEQRKEVGGVDLEVLVSIQGRRARRVAATMDRGKRPARLQGGECAPGSVRTRTSVD
jgi:hypothetical protein